MLAPPYLDMVTGDVVLPTVAAEGHDLAAAALTGTAYLSYGNTDWTVPGEYTGDDPVSGGGVPAGLTEDFTFTPQTPDVANSYSRLNAIADEVLTLDDSQLPGKDGIITVSVWPERNQVLVEAAAVTSEMRLALANRYGVNSVVIWLNPTNVRPEPLDSRQKDAVDSDDPALNGGSVYTNTKGTSCTTGFAWGGTTQMVTAGHCNPVNVGLEIQSYPNGIHIGERTLSTFQKGVGTVKIPGQSAVYGDLSIMTILTKLTAPSIFIGGRDSDVKRNVEGRWGAAPKVGDLFCIGGAETGQSCNWKVQDISDQYRSLEGETSVTVVRGYRYNRCADHGDSGGPVFTIRPDTGNVVAKGIISGGSIDPNTKNPPANDCVIYFTDIRNVVKAFGGDIAKRN